MANPGEQAGGEQHFIAIQATPIYQGPEDGSPIAEGGTAQLLRGDIFAGRLDRNDSIWIATGIGFVPAASAKGPCFSYQATADIWIQEDHTPDARVAEIGTARLHQTQMFTAVPVNEGWLWISTGIGFVSAQHVRLAGPAPVTYPSQRRSYIVQPGDNLSSIAEKFYGSQDRAMYLYTVNQAIIGSDPQLVQTGQQLSIP